ncbi:MAG TPA: MOSC domain-containing protein [Vicinamibacteria bacterium]|nr:MOSC domain-containing protein [Vicinamibacteria bacterium]
MTPHAGKLERIWIKRSKRGPMDERNEVRLLKGRGIAENANQGGKRQVTILGLEGWQSALSEIGADNEVSPRERRANLLVSGVDLRESRGRVLRIGAVRLRVYGETRPCEQMDGARPGLRSALQADWRGGCFGEVLDDGTIAIGDEVAWLES